MLKPIVLKGKTPYKIEYSSALLKNGPHSYANPYKLFYAGPHDHKSSIIDGLISEPVYGYKKSRVLEEYRFFYTFGKITYDNLNINFIF